MGDAQLGSVAVPSSVDTSATVVGPQPHSLTVDGVLASRPGLRTHGGPDLVRADGPNVPSHVDPAATTDQTAQTFVESGADGAAIGPDALDVLGGPPAGVPAGLQYLSPQTSALERAAGQALPRIEGWVTVAVHRELAEALLRGRDGVDRDTVRDRFIHQLTNTEQWRRAKDEAAGAGRAGPSVLLLSCDAAQVSWRNEPQSFAAWLRERTGAQRLMTSTHTIVQSADGSLRAEAEEPARSILFTDSGVEWFGPDLLEAIQVADRINHGAATTIHPASEASRHEFARLGGRYEWLQGEEIESTIASIDRGTDDGTGPPGTELARAGSLMSLLGDGLYGYVPEARGAPTLLFDDEVVGADRAAVYAEHDAIRRTLLDLRGETTLADLFSRRPRQRPALTALPQHRELRVIRSPYAEGEFAQFTAGVAPEMLWANYQWMYQQSVAFTRQLVRGRLAQAIDFGRWYAQLFNGEKPADLSGFSPVVTAAGYATMLYTLFDTLARLHLTPSMLLKNYLDWAPRVALDRMYETLPVELQLALQVHGPMIEQELLRRFSDYHRKALDRVTAEEGRPINLLHDRLPDPSEPNGYRNYTLADYIRTGWTPHPPRRFSPRAVFGVGAFPVDTNSGHLKHVTLIPGEYRTLVPGVLTDQEWKAFAALLRAHLRGLYRDLMATRTPAGALLATPVYSRLAAAELRLLAGRLDLAGPDPAAREAADRLQRTRRGAAVLFGQLDAPDPALDGALGLDLSRLAPAVAELAGEQRTAVVRAAVEAVHLRLDAATRARVARVDATAVALPKQAVMNIRVWFPNAVVRTPDGEAPPLRHPQRSDEYVAAHTAPEVVPIAELEYHLINVAVPYGGLDGLADDLGISVARLREVAYHTAAVYGMEFTEANLAAMRRLGDALRPHLGRVAVVYQDLEMIVREVRGDGDSPQPVDPGQIRVLADLMADLMADLGALDRDMSVAQLRRRVLRRLDVHEALRWVVPLDQFSASPDWIGVPRLLARLRDLAGGPAGFLALMNRVVARHPEPERPRRLFDSAHLAAALFGERFTDSDIEAVDRLLSATDPPGSSWKDLDALVRYLFNDPPGRKAADQRYSAEPMVRKLIELVRDLGRDVSDAELRRQVAGVDEPASPVSRELNTVWRERLRQHYELHHRNLLQQLRAGIRMPRPALPFAQRWNEERALWDAIALLHAAQHRITVTVEEARAARALRDSPLSAGLPPLRTVADVQRFIDTSIREPDEPRPQDPGAVEEDLQRLLDAAMDALAAQPGRPVTVEELRRYWRSPSARSDDWSDGSVDDLVEQLAHLM